MGLSWSEGNDSESTSEKAFTEVDNLNLSSTNNFVNTGEENYQKIHSQWVNKTNNNDDSSNNSNTVCGRSLSKVYNLEKVYSQMVDFKSFDKPIPLSHMYEIIDKKWRLESGIQHEISTISDVKLFAKYDFDYHLYQGV